MQRKRILILTSEFPPQPGGIGNHAYHLAKHLELNGYKVKVITDQRSVLGEEERQFDSSLKVIVFRVKWHKPRLFMYIKRISLLFKHIKSSDIVIASGKFSLWSVALASIFFKRDYIATLHGTEVNFKNILLKLSINLSLKRFTKLIAVSNYTKSLVNTAHKYVEVIPNGIDTEQLKTILIDDIDIEGHPKLITVGNVTDRKGQLNVIKHLPRLLNQYPKLHYHCVGLPTQKEEFLAVVHTLNLSNHVTFHGRLPNEQMVSFLKSSDIFVMLSDHTQTGDVEGFGIALLEANYFGLPTIGSKGCGIEDAIDDYSSGRLVYHNDFEAFKNAMNDILTNAKTYRAEAQHWSLQHSWQLIVKKYIKVLET